MSGFDNQASMKVAYVKKALNDPRNKHTCHWPGCNIIVKPAFWGCYNHWMQLPAWARSMIWATYNPMQEIKKNPSKAYIDVVTKVEVWIIAQEVWQTIAPMVRAGNLQNLGVVHHPL